MFVSQQNSVPAQHGVRRRSRRCRCGRRASITPARSSARARSTSTRTPSTSTTSTWARRSTNASARRPRRSISSGWCSAHDWQPLQPTSGEVSGNVVTVHFHVPVPPLVWDETLPPPHGTLIPAVGPGARLRGLVAASVRQTIDSVEIVGADTVRITCRDDLSAREVLVAYAATAEGATLADRAVCPLGPPARFGPVRRFPDRDRAAELLRRLPATGALVGARPRPGSRRRCFRRRCFPAGTDDDEVASVGAVVHRCTGVRPDAVAAIIDVRRDDGSVVDRCLA